MFNYISLPFISRGEKLYRKLGGPHSGTRSFGKEKILLCQSGFETRSNNTKYNKAYFVIPDQRICSVIMAVTIFYFRKGLITGCNFKISYRHFCNLWPTKRILCLSYRKATVSLFTKFCIKSSNIC